MKRTYWTPERDEELKRHEAAGLSASKIATLLHTTRSAVIGRSNRLRGNRFISDIERLERQRIAAAKTPERDHARQGSLFAAMGADLATKPRQTPAIFAGLRADLAAGMDRDVVIKRGLGAGIGPAALGEFFALSIAQVYQIGGPRRIRPRWTREQVELLLSMWPDHSAREIAAALGTTPCAVFGKRWRMGLGARTSAPEHFPHRASPARPA